MIESYSFGHMKIDGKDYSHDIKIKIGKKFVSYSGLTTEIDRLEMKIETDAMSFEAEKKVMKTIKELKKKKKELKDDSNVFDKAKDIAKGLNTLRKDSSKLHKSVKEKAKDSQQKHKEVLDLSEKFDNLKEEEKVAFDKFLEFKDNFNKVNDELKKRLALLREKWKRRSRKGQSSRQKTFSSCRLENNSFFTEKIYWNILSYNVFFAMGFWI